MLSAIAMKLTSSIDDVVWLVPFLIIKNRRKVIIHVSIYMWVCLIQAILALAIAQGGVAALDAMTATKKGWSSDKILSVGAGGLLFAYGLWLLREWWLDDDDDDDGEGGDNGGEGESESLVGSGDDKEKRERPCDDYGSDKDGKHSSSGGDEEGGSLGADLCGCCGTGGGGSDGEVAGKKQERSTNSLFVVAFLGSLDDLTLFVPMLVGQAMNWLELREYLVLVLVLVVCACVRARERSSSNRNLLTLHFIVSIA